VGRRGERKESFGAKRSLKPFHPHLGPPSFDRLRTQSNVEGPSRGRKRKEGDLFAA